MLVGLSHKSKKVLLLLVSGLLVLGFIPLSTNPSFAADFQFTGPNSGHVNTESAQFTVTTGGGFNGNIRVQILGAGIDTTKSLNFSGTDVSQSFTITPTQLGTVTLTAHSMRT